MHQRYLGKSHGHTYDNIRAIRFKGSGRGQLPPGPLPLLWNDWLNMLCMISGGRMMGSVYRLQDITSDTRRKEDYIVVKY